MFLGIQSHILDTSIPAVAHQDPETSTTMAEEEGRALSSAATEATANSDHGPKWATNDDWEKHRLEITALYRDSNKTLKEVMAHMESQYQFRAT
jgi:hypothetical protein